MRPTSQSHHFNLYFRPPTPTSLLDPRRLESEFKTALGSSQVGRLAAIDDHITRREPNATWFWLDNLFSPPSVPVRAVELLGFFSIEAGGYAWLSLSADAHLVEYPGVDLGYYFRQIVAPLARQVGASMATIDDERGVTPALVAALESQRLPFKSDGYFLEKGLVGALRPKVLRKAIQRARKDYAAVLRREGLAEDIPDEAIDALEEPPRHPNPFIEEYPDGSWLVYGLVPRGRYWKSLGLPGKDKPLPRVAGKLVIHFDGSGGDRKAGVSWEPSLEPKK